MSIFRRTHTGRYSTARRRKAGLASRTLEARQQPPQDFSRRKARQQLGFPTIRFQCRLQNLVSRAFGRRDEHSVSVTQDQVCRSHRDTVDLNRAIENIVAEAAGAFRRPCRESCGEDRHPVLNLAERGRIGHRPIDDDAGSTPGDRRGCGHRADRCMQPSGNPKDEHISRVQRVQGSVDGERIGFAQVEGSGWLPRPSAARR